MAITNERINDLIKGDLISDTLRSRLETQQLGGNPLTPRQAPQVNPQIQPQIPQGIPTQTPRPNPLQDFIWFNRQADPLTGAGGRTGAISALGQSLSGFAAPFLGQKFTPQPQDTSNQAFQEWLLKQQINPSFKTEKFDLQLRKQAATEATREFGGTAFLGLSLNNPKKKAAFDKRVNEIYRGFRVQYGLSESGEVSPDVDDTDPSVDDFVGNV